MQTEQEYRQQMVEIGRRLDARRMVSGADGNLSVRLPEGRILITPTGLAKGRLTPEDLVVLDARGRRLSGARNASSEAAMHLAAYAARADVHACVHAHPPYVTSFAVAGIELPNDILPEMVVLVGPVPLTEYAPPGTSAVPDSLAPFLRDHVAFLLRSHGLLTIGADLEEAYIRHETVEHFARILHLARQLGNVQRIPDEDFARLDELRTQLRRSTPPSQE